MVSQKSVELAIRTHTTEQLARAALEWQERAIMLEHTVRDLQAELEAVQKVAKRNHNMGVGAMFGMIGGNK